MKIFLSSLAPYPYNFAALQRARGISKEPLAALPAFPKASLRKLPVTINPKHAERFTSMLEAPAHPIYTHSYSHGWVTRDGSHINKDNRLIAEISTHYRQTPENHPALNRMRLFRPVHHPKGKLLSLTGLGYYNYYHWIFEQLPKLHLAQQQGLLAQKDWTLYAPTVLTAQLDGLRRITALPILESQKHPSVRAEEIWGASPTSAVLEPSPWVTDWLRESFLEMAESTNSPEKIFVNRPNAKSRRIINNAEVLTWAKEMGFTEITLEDKSFAQQISLFKNAKEILAPHGAGLSNLVFCQKGTLFMELLGDSVHRPAKQTETCYWALANIMHSNYGCLECKTIGSQNETYNLEVCIPELKALYQKLHG